jgi:hypothetical protein
MREDCQCPYCKEKVNEYFCSKCFYNFNECEVLHSFEGVQLCPKCHPKPLSDKQKKDASLMNLIHRAMSGIAHDWS